MNQQEVVLKHVKCAVLAQQEISALTEMKDIPHIARLLSSYPAHVPSSSTAPAEETVVLVFPVYLPLSSRKLDLYQIATYIKQLAQILSQVHASGWVHLDVSPKNLMLDPHDGHVVLIDFGLSRKIGSTHLEGCGTPGYIAPEVYSDTVASPCSDVYSAGVILGQLLEPYVPGISLHYLGSPLVRHPTTAFICKKIAEMKQADSSQLTWAPIISSAADLLSRMIASDGVGRITPSEMLRHPFLTASQDEFEGFDYESFSQRLLLRPLSALKTRNSREPLVLYRG
ncbi:hypothetical protein HDV03_004426 [Kappamyces sp. JEL0829]|nr:hypothetical protein HDV03_004426 [Kappamyces sp. JEL0829]